MTSESNLLERYPNLDLGHGIRLPAPTLPLAFAAFSLVFGRRRWRHRAHDLVPSKVLQVSLAVLHSVLYIWNVWSLLGDISTTRNHSLCLLEFAALVFGETALEQPSSLSSTLTAIGWIYENGANGLHDRSHMWASPAMSACIKFLLATPCAWQIGGGTSVGAMLSGVSLMTGIMVSTSVGEGSLTERLPGGTALCVVGTACLSILVQQTKIREWHPRLNRAIQNFNTDDVLQAQCLSCLLLPIQFMALVYAGWILASYLWSCFPWRRLFLGQPSGPPTWDQFSFAGGMLYSAFLVVPLLLRPRDPVADVATFVRRRLEDCMIALQWSNVGLIVLWLLCEAIMSIEIK